MYISERLKNVPPYLFSQFEKKKRELLRKGVDVIDLGIGIPNLPTPQFIIDQLINEVKNPQNHRYSPYQGCREFRLAVSEFYSNYYGVHLDPDTEVLALIGSKEGIVHFVEAIINPEDQVLIPDPGYPVYRSSVFIAGGKTEPYRLYETNGFIPDFSEISKQINHHTKLMILNYPSNPTGATIDLETFREAVDFCKEHNIILINDAAYDLVTFGDYKSPSILQIPGAKDIAIEFGSLSKSFNMTGWRIGYAVGNKQLIQTLATLKSNLDSSQFLPIQIAAAAALKSDLSEAKNNCSIIEKRMTKMCGILNHHGLTVKQTRGTIFLWAKVPTNYTAADFAERLLEQAGIIVTPGTAFGSNGEGFIRVSLSIELEKMEEVNRRFLTFK